MNKLAQITKLIKNSGNRIIVTNDELEPKFVLMSVGDYEKILQGNDGDISGLTEEELLAKINRDIAEWKSENGDMDSDPENHIESVESFTEIPEEDFKENEEKSSVDLNITKNDIVAEEDDKYYFEPVDEQESLNI